MSHACPAGCGRDVPAEQYACARDWYRLPAPIRAAIWRGYRSEPLGKAHIEAMKAAADWYERNPLPAPKTQETG